MRVREFCAAAMANMEERPSPKAPGVYVIFNRVTMRAYIGKAGNIDSRFRSHREKLRSGKHFSPAMQEDWTRYGEGVFEFCVYALAKAEEMAAIEESLIAESMGDECYNRRTGGGRPLLNGEFMMPRQIRMLDSEWEKCRRLGGAAWLREQIALATV